MTAPLQVLALTFAPGADAQDAILAEVDRLSGRGVLRVLDLVFLAKDQDGAVEQLEIGDDEDFGSLLGGLILPEDGAAGLGGGGDPAAFLPEDADALAQALEPGTALAFLLVEHHWAGPLFDVIAAAGGSLISDGFLTAGTGRAMAAQVAALEDATAVIAQAQAAETAAVLRAVTAAQEAAAAEEVSERIPAAAAADAVSALIAAGLIEAAAAREAVGALAAAGLIADAADQSAADAVATMVAADQVTTASLAQSLATISAADEVAAEATGEAAAKMRAASMTRSEAQVLRYLPEPVPFAVIADKLGISRSAAKERAERLYQRLGVHSRAEAVSQARVLGLLRGR
jgi:DNA-binding NarL/FixJ family response regulator